MNSIIDITYAGNSVFDAMVFGHKTGNHINLITVSAGN